MEQNNNSCSLWFSVILNHQSMRCTPVNIRVRIKDPTTIPRCRPFCLHIRSFLQKAIGNGREDVVHVVHVIRSNGNAIVTARQSSEHKPTVYGSIAPLAKMAPSNGVGFNRYKETRLLRLVIQITHTPKNQSKKTFFLRIGNISQAHLIQACCVCIGLCMAVLCSGTTTISYIAEVHNIHACQHASVRDSDALYALIIIAHTERRVACCGSLYRNAHF